MTLESAVYDLGVICGGVIVVGGTLAAMSFFVWVVSVFCKAMFE